MSNAAAIFFPHFCCNKKHAKPCNIDLEKKVGILKKMAGLNCLNLFIATIICYLLCKACTYTNASTRKIPIYNSQSSAVVGD